MADFNSGSPACITWVLARFVGNNNHPFCALGVYLVSNLRNIQRAVHRLPTCHRHCVVIKNFKRYVGAGRDGCANCEQTRMEICAITNILKHMLICTERTLTDPAGTLSSHLGKTRCVPIHPLRHKVTTNPRKRPTPFRNRGRTIVRATGTKIRRSNHWRRKLLILLNNFFDALDSISQFTIDFRLAQSPT